MSNRNLFFSILLLSSSLSFSSEQETKVSKEVKELCELYVANSVELKFTSTQDLSDVTLFFRNDSFFVVRNGIETPIFSFNLDKELRDLDEDSLYILKENGLFHLSKIEDDEFVLRMSIKGLGGGPIMAKIFQTLTKIVGSAVMGAAMPVEVKEVKQVATALRMGNIALSIWYAEYDRIIISYAASHLAKFLRQHGYESKCREAVCTSLATGITIERAANAAFCIGAMLPGI